MYMHNDNINLNIFRYSDLNTPSNSNPYQTNINIHSKEQSPSKIIQHIDPLGLIHFAPWIRQEEALNPIEEKFRPHPNSAFTPFFSIDKVNPIHHSNSIPIPTDSPNPTSPHFFSQEMNRTSSRKRKERRKVSQVSQKCFECRREVKNWRKGPDGKANLCNTCGTNYSLKVYKKKFANTSNNYLNDLDKIEKKIYCLFDFNLKNEQKQTLEEKNMIISNLKNNLRNVLASSVRNNIKKIKMQLKSIEQEINKLSIEIFNLERELISCPIVI
jgi:hypothetical protein